MVISLVLSYSTPNCPRTDLLLCPPPSADCSLRVILPVILQSIALRNPPYLHPLALCYQLSRCLTCVFSCNSVLRLWINQDRQCG